MIMAVMLLRRGLPLVFPFVAAVLLCCWPSPYLSWPLSRCCCCCRRRKPRRRRIDRSLPSVQTNGPKPRTAHGMKIKRSMRRPQYRSTLPPPLSCFFLLLRFLPCFCCFGPIISTSSWRCLVMATIVALLAFVLVEVLDCFGFQSRSKLPFRTARQGTSGSILGTD
jgi:hypothetical protein